MIIKPIHAEFGARVSAIDLTRPLERDSFAQIDAAINRYSLLLFADQAMNDSAQLELTARFGPLEEEHVSYYSHGVVTYIGRVGNINVDGSRVSNRQIKASTGNEMWHSDSSFREIPAQYSLLAAYEVPDIGGETEFVSARAAYRRLDPATREQIENRIGIHDYVFSRSQVGADAVTENQRKYMHPVRQRLVRQNPLTGERNLFVGSHVKAIEGMPDAAARVLIASLMAEVTRPESVFRHRWRIGDFMIWDNRCVLHRGCGYDAQKYRRRMHQTRVRGFGPSIAETLGR